MTVITFCPSSGGARCVLSRAYPRREQLFPPEGVSPLHRSFQIPRGHPAIWRGADPAACESPLRAPRRGCEQNGRVTLGSKPKVQTALRWETPASSSSRYRLLQNGTPVRRCIYAQAPHPRPPIAPSSPAYGVASCVQCNVGVGSDLDLRAPKREVRFAPYRTSSAWRGTSGKCHLRTHAPANRYASIARAADEQAGRATGCSPACAPSSGGVHHSGNPALRSVSSSDQLGLPMREAARLLFCVMREPRTGFYSKRNATMGSRREACRAVPERNPDNSGERAHASAMAHGLTGNWPLRLPCDRNHAGAAQQRADHSPTSSSSPLRSKIAGGCRGAEHRPPYAIRSPACVR